VKVPFRNPQKKLYELIDTADSLSSVYEYLGR
jgi:hypothetical protein